MIIIQKPNPPLITAAVSYLFFRFTTGFLTKLTGAVFYMALTVWAWEEAVRGVNWFRKVLGIIVLVWVLVKLLNSLRV